jgi:large subunit ribosomal protein L25
MESFNLSAEPRAVSGKGGNRKLRKSGSTPGVVYRAGEEGAAIAFNGAALSAIFRKTNNPNTLVNIAVGEAQRVCLVREIQRHPVSRSVEHVDFLEVQPGETVSVTVPVVSTGRAAGVRAGGQLRLLARSVNLVCDAVAVPATIEVDVTNLEIGKFVKASQLPLPAGSRIVFAQDFNVLTVAGKIVVAVAADAAPAKPAAKGKK